MKELRFRSIYSIVLLDRQKTVSISLSNDVKSIAIIKEQRIRNIYSVVLLDRQNADYSNVHLADNNFYSILLDDRNA